MPTAPPQKNPSKALTIATVIGVFAIPLSCPMSAVAFKPRWDSTPTLLEEIIGLTGCFLFPAGVICLLLCLAFYLVRR